MCACVCAPAQSVSHVWLFPTTWTIACQGPLSMEFSSQEYWGGLLLQGIFLTQGSNSHLLGHLHWQTGSLPLVPLGSASVQGILQARIQEWVAIAFSRGSSRPRNRTHVSCTAVKFFTVWATREAQEYWSSLSLLQWIFLTQELNWGFLHCRQILYQLSYQGSPFLILP